MRAAPMKKADGATLARARLGLVTRDVASQVARGFAGGVEVTDPGDNKEAAAGDVIVKVGDMPVRTTDDLGRWLEGAAPDGEVAALVLRPDKAGGAPASHEKRNINLKLRRG